MSGSSLLIKERSSCLVDCALLLPNPSILCQKQNISVNSQNLSPGLPQPPCSYSSYASFQRDNFAILGYALACMSNVSAQWFLTYFLPRLHKQLLLVSRPLTLKKLQKQLYSLAHLLIKLSM